MSDQYLSSAQGKSNQKVYILDETGRSYALAINSLPSAWFRRTVEFKTFSSANGVGFMQVLIEDEEKEIVAVSSKGLWL